MKTYEVSIGLDETNKTLSIDSCICTEDIYSKTDVWQAVRLSIGYHNFDTQNFQYESVSI